MALSMIDTLNARDSWTRDERITLLNALADGKSEKQIAELLDRSLLSVRRKTMRLRRSANALNNTQLVATAIREGVI